MKAVIVGEPSGASMMAVYPRHKAVADRFKARGEVIGIGPFADLGNMGIFRTREAAEAFAREDPHAGSCELEQPPDISRCHEVPWRAHHVRPKDSSPRHPQGAGAWRTKCADCAIVAQQSRRSRAVAAALHRMTGRSEVEGERFPAPQAHSVVSAEFMTEIASQHADLTAVMGIMLAQVRQHVDHSARHALHARVTRTKGGFEQGREFIGRLAQGPACLAGRHPLFVERRRPWSHATHPRERPADALHMRDDARDRSTTSAWWRHPPQGDGQHAREVLRYVGTVPECLDDLLFHFQWSSSRHMRPQRGNLANPG